MAHFAKIENETVVAVHVIANDEIVDEDGVEQESLGIARCNELIGEATWVQTSYNNNFRKNYAGKGFTYDQTRDAFIEPKPPEPVSQLTKHPPPPPALGTAEPVIDEDNPSPPSPPFVESPTLPSSNAPPPPPHP